MLFSLKHAWNFTSMNILEIAISYYYLLFTLGLGTETEMRKDKNKWHHLIFRAAPWLSNLHRRQLG